jgi:hypothetical protein
VGARSLFVLSAMILAAPALGAPAKEAPKREGFNEPFVLANLKHVKVVVAKLDAYATDHGASADHIKQILTDGLAPTHMTLVDSDGDGGKAGASSSSKDCGPSDTPLMYLKLRTTPDEGGSKGASCSVSLALVEKAKIARNKKDLMVSVWRDETVCRLGDNVKEGIDQQVEGVLKNFHRDYMLANSADSSKDVPEETHGKPSKKHKAPR